MKILTYLKVTGITREALAEKAGLSRMALYNLIHYRGSPTMVTVKKIEAATNGKVTYRDLSK